MNKPPDKIWILHPDLLHEFEQPCYGTDPNEGADYVEYRLASTAPRWVLVEEELPKEDKVVLACWKGDGHEWEDCAVYSNGEWWSMRDESVELQCEAEITHWLSHVPDPPQGEMK